MTTLRLTRALTIGGRKRKSGDVVEAPPFAARKLVLSGAAVYAETQAAPKPALEPDAAVNLDDMTRDELVAYANDVLGLSVSGNVSKAKARRRINEAL